MKRALAEGTRVEEAAEYFTYGDSVPDYFAGMDAISQQLSNGKPDQLLDQTRDETGFHRPQTEVKPEKLNLNRNERIGRNTWMVWCAGNEGFWDWLATDSLGFIDFLKLVDTRKRSDRFREAGMINEPGMDQAGKPAPGEFGLWLDLPKDDRTRKWREAYVAQTFKQLQDGQHKSQIGLRKRGRYGQDEGPLLFTGDPATYRGEKYRYPSSYIQKSSDDYDANGNANDYKAGNFYDETIPPPDSYGLSSGVIGLRLFPNPYFDEEAQKKWDADKYYNEKSYSSDPKLVRPYRVGMSCAFCHASFHPLQPAHDLNNPAWRNISGNIGAQYLRMRPTVGNLLTPNQFVYHLIESQPAGTIDTSLIASDNINNPNTFNAIFGLPQRAILSLHNPSEKLSPDSASLPSLWRNPEANAPGDAEDPVPEMWKTVAADLGLSQQVENSNENPRDVPRILLDGSDSIGAWGALARVYLNIGSYWEEWNRIHQVVIGFTPQQPFRLRNCETYSVYWNATTKRVPGLRDYFLKITPPMPLLSTEGGQRRIEPVVEADVRQRAELENRDFATLLLKERAKRVDIGHLQQGRQAFARNCIVCHSSIQPENMQFVLANDPPMGDFTNLIQRRNEVRLASEDNGEFWEHDPAQWLNDPEYIRWALDVVEKTNFWTQNYLSTDYRIPINVVGTNSGRALATNAMTGHMWQDFASESYRSLPSVGTISYFNPYAGADGEYQKFMPRHKTAGGAPSGGGGPGFYRVPTLISIWATAPLLHNNSLGLFNNDPSVDGRLQAFDDAIRKLLWRERRLESSSYNEATPERLKRDHGLIWRTTEESYLTLDAKRVPYFAQRLPYISHLYQYVPWLKYVRPLWLPSVILLVGALGILLVSNHRHRRIVAFTVLIGTILAAVLLWFVRTYPEFSLFAWLRLIEPWWLPPLILSAIGLFLLVVSLGSRASHLRWSAYIVLAIAVSWAIVAGFMRAYPDISLSDALRDIHPPWLPLLAALFIGVVLWLPLSRTWTRWFGYLSLVGALAIGVIVYFNAGRLGDVSIGPIPKGTPVNLLANFNSEAEQSKQIQSLRTVISALGEIDSRHLMEEDKAKVMKTKVAPALMDVNKCPDFVMDRGHYFPWFDDMSDADKEALIELLKTF